MPTRKLFPAAVLAILAGCGGTADVEPPELRILSAEPAAGPGWICGVVEPGVYALSGGDTLALSLELTDNEGLSQLKVDIHGNFDCHGHARLAGPDTEDWSVLDLIDLEGTARTLDLRLPAPANPTAGPYHFQFRLVDAAGNEAPEPFVYSINLGNAADTVAPLLTATDPVAGTGLSLARGASRDFALRLEDDRPLGEGGNGRVELRYIRAANGNSFLADALDFGPAEGALATPTLTLTVPTTVIPGAYTVEARAWDGVRNEAARLSWPLEITD